MLTVAYNDTRVTNVLRESFSCDVLDGYWYPMDGGDPLVRVYVGGNGYMIERRRSPSSTWLPIVTAEYAEFDPNAFRAWRKSYPMTV